MSNFKIYSGIDSIGGNILQVSTDSARIITDFGLKKRDNDLKHSRWSELETTILQRELPAIPGVFPSDKIEHMEELDSFDQENRPQAVLISHLHIDHMGGLKYLPKDLEVYMSTDSYKLYKELVAVGEETGIQATIKPVDYGQTVQIEDIQFTFHQSDHDVLGASAIFIQTPNLKMIHSGDLRLSGMNPDRVKAMVKAARDFEADILFIEGTSFSFDPDESEEDNKEGWASERDLLDHFAETLSQDKFLVINPYIRNIERLYHLNQRAVKAGRPIVWEPVFAKLIKAFYPDASLFELKDLAESEPGFDRVSLEEVKSNPHQYVLHNTFDNLDLLQGISGLYLHMNGEPLGDYDSNYQRLIDFLNQHHFDFVSFGASGHAEREDLVEVAKKIDAGRTVAWHTFEPEIYDQALKNAGIETFAPSYNQSYTREDL